MQPEGISMDRNVYARVAEIPAKVGGIPVRPTVLDRFRKMQGQIVCIPGDRMFWFHERDDFATICPLRGPQDEGVFYTLPLAWLTGQDDEEIQRIGKRLMDTFWERTEYTEAF
jgi:hypothetical protein